MNLNDMLRELRDERGRIDQAISALQGLDSAGSNTAGPRRGRPPGSRNRQGVGGRRRMSAAARRRISEAAKARWAARGREDGGFAGEIPTARHERGRPEANVGDDEGALGGAEQD